MAATNYTPADTLPDLDGAGRLGSSGGPLQLPADGDPYTYVTNIVSVAPNGGVLGKILNALFYIVKRGPDLGQTTLVESGVLFDQTPSPPGILLSGLTTATAGHSIMQPLLRLRHGMKLTSVSFWAKPDAHGALPANMPNFRVWRQPINGTTPTAIAAAVTDTSANTGAYDVAHTIAAPITAGNGTAGAWEIVDLTANVYYGQYVVESGANSDNNTVMLGCVSTIAYV